MSLEDDGRTRPLISVICPCYNEEEVIPAFYDRLTHELRALHAETDYRIVFVDDGSQDRTLGLLIDISGHDEKVSVYSLSRNFGHQAALCAGLEVAPGDAVILMDSDLQHPPALIRDLLAKWKEGYCVVTAVRRETEGASWWKRWTSSAFYKLFNSLSHTYIVPGAADFCLLSREVCDALNRMPEQHRFIRGMISWLGFKRAFVEYTADSRAGGASKYSFSRMLQLAMDAVFSFSIKPIRLAFHLGLLFIAFSVAYFCYIVARYFYVGDLIAGWGSMMCVLLASSGVNLLCLGILGEYLARTYEQVKIRPQYVFRALSARDKIGTPNGKN